jgi:hypothetical protein
MRVALITGAVLTIAAISIGVASDNAPGSAAPAGISPAAAAATPPGLQPSVQAWLKAREKGLIELNNALVPIVQVDHPSGAAGKAACARVLAAARAMSGRAKAPDARVDTLARAGLAKIEQGAAACVAGDAVGGKQLITQGLAERTAATEPFDDTLEGE